MISKNKILRCLMTTVLTTATIKPMETKVYNAEGVIFEAPTVDNDVLTEIKHRFENPKFSDGFDQVVRYWTPIIDCHGHIGRRLVQALKNNKGQVVINNEKTYTAPGTLIIFTNNAPGYQTNKMVKHFLV